MIISPANERVLITWLLTNSPSFDASASDPYSKSLCDFRFLWFLIIDYFMANTPIGLRPPNDLWADGSSQKVSRIWWWKHSFYTEYSWLGNPHNSHIWRMYDIMNSAPRRSNQNYFQCLSLQAVPPPARQFSPQPKPFFRPTAKPKWLEEIKNRNLKKKKRLMQDERDKWDKQTVPYSTSMISRPYRANETRLRKTQKRFCRQPQK